LKENQENDLQQLLTATEPYDRWKQIILMSRKQGDADTAGTLFVFFEECPQTFWRLLALFAIDHIYEGSDLPRQMLAQAASYLNSKDGILLRGLVGFLANRKTVGLPYLIDFLQTNQHLMLREDILTAAIYHAANGDQALIQEFAKQNTNFSLYCRHRVWPQNFKANYDVFPYSDYLYRSALTMGLTKKQFKSLYFIPWE